MKTVQTTSVPTYDFLVLTDEEWKATAKRLIRALEVIDFELKIGVTDGCEELWDASVGQTHAAKYGARKGVALSHFGPVNMPLFRERGVFETVNNKTWKHRLRFSGSWSLHYDDFDLGSPLDKVNPLMYQYIIPFDVFLRRLIAESTDFSQLPEEISTDNNAQEESPVEKPITEEPKSEKPKKNPKKSKTSQANEARKEGSAPETEGK